MKYEVWGIKAGESNISLLGVYINLQWAKIAQEEEELYYGSRNVFINTRG